MRAEIKGNGVVDMQKLLSILNQLREQIRSHKLLSEKNKAKIDSRLQAVISTYEELGNVEDSEELIRSLIKGGTELQLTLRKSKDSKEVKERAWSYIRYVQAAVYDLKGDIKGINHYTRFFIIMAALFIALTPQFYGFIFPLVFALPIFSGLKGIKKRSRTAFILTMSVVPMSLMTGITWMQYLFKVVLKDFAAAVTEMASTGVSQGLATGFTVAGCVLGVVLVVLASTTAYLGYRYRDMFV